MKLAVSDSILVVLWAAGVALTTNACALTSKAGVVDVRYFNPEHIEPRMDRDGVAGSRPALAPTLQLRLGRVSSGPNLRERIAYRDSAYELGYYEDLRWTERPETYIRRALGRSLFETHTLRRVLTGAAPTLDVELVAFDELRTKANRAARIQLKAILYEENDVLFEDTLTIDAPVVGATPKIEDVIAAMATALDTASNELASKVYKALVGRNLATTAELAP